MEFVTVIGLEVHAQLKTRTKIFCGCSTAFGAPPNTHVCPVCLGMPGVLPVLNRKVAAYAVKMGIATHCTINRESRFARKNYFYPDLPKGYQISQYELPICEHGYIEIDGDGEKKRIGITRIHMEEDAGKLIHHPGRSVSHVDLNRTGVPLIEIVSEPDIRSPEEAGSYLRKLHAILRYLDICDGNMEEGSFRCDANVSIMPAGATAFGTRTELKNLNSFRHVEKALHYEIVRQQEVIGDGGTVVQETRLWNPDRGVTTPMRGKEEAHDYRYFPDPDLLPVVVDDAWIREITAGLPELPDAREKRFVEVLGLTPYDAGVLTAERELADYFEACLEAYPRPKPAANWIMGPLLGLLNSEGKDIGASPIAPADLGALLKLVDDGTLSGKIAKTVFEEMAATGRPPGRIVAEKQLVQLSDGDAIEGIINDVLAGHPDEVAAFRGGKTKLMGFFVGEVMRATKGKANPKMVNEILWRKLG
ncbi:Asp-tRNA(Asn)/Glu-tRNA(Gln) amidotransferase subunit GatB [Desulfococcus multivorans]|uniref:Aspartyl/glutamyl-tRNA(Asn/Gln) amidotransferase subunit B n=1 Tax=Desulfococcus multivorans DSM 2059 TaxID=1121405 RepID=S7V3M0_DESML|nr:Asp-tRNA(Asn)/Glu-tRNA(Gln) amidotransferase subunit GatB [Desulfococcus multivorans]AOY60317.1 GatB2: glutamyl-tRNA(Gln) amidotransferase, subunit B [Desulfococcus multivorans]AQV02423.1 aspartyl/glutamyl-tRNA amidotransferase subunit B [Desulfococcus multivorans]EPR39243.1 Aspartyl/glutamyl-tRNA(Asn/Gln) amidotransferase subunit B [Desulfococcus multivorans DSM 2059]SJZ58664.1 aspartyl/glutamyl-tRNA(Asn/Gln) amidotransferase subunit B [Desulfococcus multivorans DSM 2059]